MNPEAIAGMVYVLGGSVIICALVFFIIPWAIGKWFR